MKILIISQYYYPEQFRINDIAAEWVKRGYEVEVITGIPNYPKGSFFDGYGWHKKRSEVHDGVKITRLPIISRGRSTVRMVLNYISFVISGFVWKCTTKATADRVFIFGLSPMTQALVGVWFAKRRRIPCSIYVQDLWPESVEIAAGISNRMILGMISKMIDYIYKSCNRIYTTSQSYVKKIIDRRVEATKVHLWYQYAEEYYIPSDTKSTLIPQDGILNITFTGNIGTAQGLEVLPETAQRLKERGVKVRFNLVGDGRNKESLKSIIAEKGLEHYFNLIDQCPPKDIPSILASSDAAFLSFADNRLYAMTIPAKLQSYMACGIPIIAAVSGESAEIIERTECGLVCRMGDASELCSIIEQFIELDTGSRKQMAENALNYARKTFDKKQLMDQMEEYENFND